MHEGSSHSACPSNARHSLTSSSLGAYGAGTRGYLGVLIRALLTYSTRQAHHHDLHIFPSGKPTAPFPLHSFDMSDPSEPAITVSLIAEALKKYEQQTGTTLANEPFAIILQECDTVERINAAFETQAKVFLDFKGEGEGKVIKRVKKIVDFLDSLSKNDFLGKAIDHIVVR